MTPADLARDNAISFECKKDALQQRQSGDWKISFTVQGVDMDQRLTRAAMGTRFVAVLVEVNDQELPVEQPAKEKAIPATRDWKELQPQQQAGIRCDDATFRAFLFETRGFTIQIPNDAAVVVRNLCGVNSRSELANNHKARVFWHQLDTEYQAWLAKERVGA